MLAKVQSAAVIGVDGIPVTVEVDVANGLPAFTTVGLPDGSVRESKDRVKAAIKNCGYSFPNRKITVNLAPADLKKEGTAFDLPIALGLLAASEVIPQDALEGYCVLGELSLDGTLRPIPGVLPIALQSSANGSKGLILPSANRTEAELAKDLNVVGVSHLYEIVEMLNGLRAFPSSPSTDNIHGNDNYQYDFTDIKGHENVKRALEIAVSGLHNILMQGPPGSGKTLLAKTLPSIMGDWSYEEQLETAKIYSVHGSVSALSHLMGRRPFRSPHHTVSDAGLIGGGAMPKPGEVSLAHNGILFLDELPEFKRHVLEVLRQPLEDGRVTISRAQSSLSFPARFMLVAAMNPCPCGYLGDRRDRCNCSEMQIQRYRSRISGPLLDRIDMHLEVTSVDPAHLRDGQKSETSGSIRERVNRARSIQENRFAESDSIRSNAQMGTREIESFCRIDEPSRKLLDNSIHRLGLSTRAYHRILKLARTIADLEESTDISSSHVAEAIQYRRGEIK